MLDFFKTASGTYNFTLIVSLIIWLVSGFGILAALHKHRTETISAIQARQRAEEAQRQEEDRRKLAESRLAAAEVEIAKLQPKPLKDRAMLWMSSIGSRVVKEARQGKREFEENMTEAQKSDLQRLCAEDSQSRYIRELQAGITRLGGGLGRDTRAHFVITDELLK